MILVALLLGSNSRVGYLTVSTERSIYSPGETIRIWGGAVTPNITWTYVNTAGKGLLVSVKIVDPSGKTVHEGKSDPALDSYKEYSYYYGLPENAVDGRYFIYVACSFFDLEGKGEFDVKAERALSLDVTYPALLVIAGVVLSAILILRRQYFRG